jgi:hypothetical protein
MDLDDIIRNSFEQEHVNLSQMSNKQQETLDYILNYSQSRTRNPLARVKNKLNRFIASMQIMDAVGVVIFIIILFIIPSLIGLNKPPYDRNLVEDPPQQTNQQQPANEGIIGGGFQKINIYAAKYFNIDKDIPVTAINDKNTLQEISTILKKAKKIPGILDAKVPDYILEIYSSNKSMETIYLWISEDGGTGMYMYGNATETGYRISEDNNEKLREIVESATKGQNIDFLTLSPELEEIYNQYSKDKNDELLRWLEPQDVCRLYFYAESKNDYETLYSLYLNDEIYQIPTKKEFLKDIDNEVNIENTAKLLKVLEEDVYNVKVGYGEANALVKIYINDKEFWGNDYMWFNVLKSKTGIWKVQFMPMQ